MDRGGVAMTVIGIDAHKRTHTLVAIDGGGRKLGQKTVSANSSGHAEAILWATTRFGTDLTWAVEDNRSVTGLLERELLAAGPWRIVRCPPHLMARSRVSARERGKSDPIDALAVARVVLREPNLPVAFHDPVSWELKLLVARRRPQYRWPGRAVRSPSPVAGMRINASLPSAK
jgi:transposase